MSSSARSFSSWSETMRETQRETPYSPTVRRLRLSSALRKLREAAGFSTAAEAARVAGMQHSKLVRLEAGKVVRPHPRDIGTLLRLYGVADPEQQELLSLARDTRYIGWWRGYGDVFRGVLPDLEAGASLIRSYEALYIPGLLQTAGYAAAIFGAEGHGEQAVARRVAARMARQDIVARERPPNLQVVIDEAALRKRIGGREVMREQLLHLVNAASHPHVSIRVVTDEAGAHPGLMGAFVLLDFPSPDDPSMVYLESAGASLCMETAKEIELYEVVFERVSAVALSEEESVQLIADRGDRLAEVDHG